jgi:ABC-type transport system substrate-binding protein
MEIWTSSGRYTKDREIGEATQAMLNSVGIRARLRTMEWAAYTKAWTAPDRMMWMVGRSTGFADFIFTRHFARASWDSGANNNTRFFDPRVEDLLVRARQEMDVKRRAAYYREIQELVWQAGAHHPALHGQGCRPHPRPTSRGWSCRRTRSWAWRWSRRRP